MRQTTLDTGITIDVSRVFTEDVPGFWECFRTHDPGLLPKDCPCPDPDTRSRVLRSYHRILWSRELPNGEFMVLRDCRRMTDYLEWNGRRFGSDSVTNSFRYQCMQEIIGQFREEVGDYVSFMEDYFRRTYTIGGEIIFPKPCKGEVGKRNQSINQVRGCNSLVKDRWDRTLECIRLHYFGKPNPLENALNEYSWFFDRFVDFEGYVEFFFLQDCVTPDHSEVVSWSGDMCFDTPALPKDVDEYRMWIQSNLDFVERRNRRIARFVESGRC